MPRVSLPGQGVPSPPGTGAAVAASRCARGCVSSLSAVLVLPRGCAAAGALLLWESGFVPLRSASGLEMRKKKGKIKIKYTVGLSVPGAPRCHEALSRLRTRAYRVDSALSLRDQVQEEKEEEEESPRWLLVLPRVPAVNYSLPFASVSSRQADARAVVHQPAQDRARDGRQERLLPVREGRALV